MDKKTKIERYRVANETAEKGQVVFAGSSLMEMFPIDKLVKEKGIPVTIYNRGIGGFVTDELMEVLDVCVTDLLPSKVFINIGTNDLSNPEVTIDELIANYDAILNVIEKKVPGVKIYLMAYYPINYEAAAEDMKECLRIRTNEKINLANEQVSLLAKKHGQQYIDVNKNLKDEKGRLKSEYTIEGLHIKEDGYRAILDDLMKYVQV